MPGRGLLPGTGEAFGRERIRALPEAAKKGVARILRQGAFMLLAAAVLLFFTGCGRWQDGEYRAECAEFDSLGYRDYLAVTVEDGEIVRAEYDAVSEDGGLKSEDEAYAGEMRPICGVDPAEFSAALNAALIGRSAKSKEPVDAVAGASYSSGRCAALLNALDQNMRKGIFETVAVEGLLEAAP